MLNTLESPAESGQSDCWGVMSGRPKWRRQPEVLTHQIPVSSILRYICLYPAEKYQYMYETVSQQYVLLMGSSALESGIGGAKT